MDYDSWKTSEPECSHCGGAHSRRYCAALKEEAADHYEAEKILEQQLATAAEQEAYFKNMGWD